MSAISTDTRLPARFNMIGAAELLVDSPFNNKQLGCNVLGDFVNRALTERRRLENVEIPLQDSGHKSWEAYFERHNGLSDRHLFIVGPETQLKLGAEAITFLREKFAGMRGYQLL